MRSDWRTPAAALLVAVSALCAFAGVTHGFAAVTSDGVRRAEIARAPRALPDLGLIDAAGRSFSLGDYGRPSPQVTFVALVYVQCQAVCLTSAAGQSWLQGEIRARGLAQRVRLLTLSFDPTRDTPPVLVQHARRLDADPGLWRFATVREAGDLRALLTLFGIVVLPDGLGGYSHNTALFLVGEDGRLSRAYDVDRPDIALADYLRNTGGT
ncbi:MAG: SCO family protein [Variovorax sp.]|nr:MAG: SCO family protein [Variovorax sp.]